MVKVDFSMFYDLLAAVQHESEVRGASARTEPHRRFRYFGDPISGSSLEKSFSQRATVGYAAPQPPAGGVLDVLDSVDVVVTPCNSTVALGPDEEVVAVSSEGEVVDHSSPGWLSRPSTRLSIPWNPVGVPAPSMPSGTFADELLVAFQLAASPLAEERLLQTALAYESTTGGYRPPPMVPTEEGARVG